MELLSVITSHNKDNENTTLPPFAQQPSKPWLDRLAAILNLPETASDYGMHLG
jgi:hypothetical protein